MWLTKRNPRVELDMPRFVDRFINDFWNDSLSAWEDDSTVWSPRVDVKETKDAYEVMADLPGLDKKDINISLRDNVLTVKGERKHEEKKEDERHYYYERSRGSFCRSFRLPEKVAEKDIKAEYKDGVLRITLHKSEEVKPRMIEIK
ncbi:Hsp20/alpha crystallin family protein [candidate division KSB1 bacterium]|nr:Hsp20/alpha crystallin family protein [candidate division KSB1 bacterium]RQW03748.1 MAG: Hsp20/alpha crystallin family protein [candidate division KSB1 bacterium]